MSEYDFSRTIVELINNDTGLDESSLDLISRGEEFMFRLRREVEERIQLENPLYGCGSCGQPVVIRSRKFSQNTHSMYFKHMHKSGDCPIKTDSNYTREEVQCMKYNGAKESKAHIELKNYIASYLKYDTRFADVRVESVIKGSGWSKKWKKPDISATLDGRKVVFEIQLSTTFLDVIVKREMFYKDEGISIFWIFSDLSPESSRATEKDVFFNNKTNALSIDKDSIARSLDSGEIVFKGFYKKPVFDVTTNKIQEVWDSKLVGFDDIKFDSVSHKPYFVSFSELNEKAQKDKEAEKIRLPLKEFKRLIFDKDQPYTARTSCAKSLHKVGLYNGMDIYSDLLNLSKALMSIKDGVVHFQNQKDKWAWLVNYVWQHHKCYWLVLLYVVDTYGRADMVFNPANNKLQEKRKAFKNGFKRDPEFNQKTEYYPLFSAMFPEIGDKLKKLM
ncbi:competence protein CoiA [Endozoicomonas euniceicola]|uniref:Competence protein CoiA n=1 Tax=Endozoicomonas euniceicola TaxID=1234143 RepID=A0ABY6GT65_9GAMM|nr:competence protein CoiA [Endozoicomonas euniceicola]UYM15955.1 competence protein CoiA [Endozoicomonas euniceicola]